VNALHERPTFYIALTRHRTTNIRVHTLPFVKSPARWGRRLLLDGKSDASKANGTCAHSYGTGPFRGHKTGSSLWRGMPLSHP
jgi:hypothetical protein